MTKPCIVHRLGVIEYKLAWKLQDQLAAEIAAGRQPATLLLLQHPHVYTFGRRGRSENLLWQEAELARRRVEVLWVDRGGDVTYHGPGQLVGYPLIPLGHAEATQPGGADSSRLPKADYVGYVRRLERVLVTALARLRVVSRQVEGLTGVWVEPHGASPRLSADSGSHPAKIAAIGVKVDARGVSRHGFALNVNPDMSYWQGIVGCGLVGYPITCLADLLSPPPSMEQVEAVVIEAFGRIFEFEMVEQTLTPSPTSVH